MDIPFGGAPDQSEGEYQEFLKDVFDQRYKSGRDVWSTDPALRDPTNALLRLLNDKREANILDIGTGRGVDAEIMLRAGHRVVGVDIVAVPGWAEIQSRYPKSTMSVGVFPYWESDLCDVFDGILDNGCLHHQHPDAYGRYVARVISLLKSGGILALTVFLNTRPELGDGRVTSLDGGRLSRLFTEQELDGFCRSFGLETIEIFVPSREEGRTPCLVILSRKP